jgi:Fe2+ or Zn2+ uptake regulation protein
MKKITSLVLDGYVLEWLKEKGNASEYVNNLLKEKMKEEGVDISEYEKKSKLRFNKVMKFILQILQEGEGEVKVSEIVKRVREKYPYVVSVEKYLKELYEAEVIEVIKKQTDEGEKIFIKMKGFLDGVVVKSEIKEKVKEKAEEKTEEKISSIEEYILKKVGEKGCYYKSLYFDSIYDKDELVNKIKELIAKNILIMKATEEGGYLMLNKNREVVE